MPAISRHEMLFHAYFTSPGIFLVASPMMVRLRSYGALEGLVAEELLHLHIIGDNGANVEAFVVNVLQVWYIGLIHIGLR